MPMTIHTVAAAGGACLEATKSVVLTWAQWASNLWDLVKLQALLQIDFIFSERSLKKIETNYLWFLSSTKEVSTFYYFVYILFFNKKFLKKIVQLKTLKFKRQKTNFKSFIKKHLFYKKNIKKVFLFIT